MRRFTVTDLVRESGLSSATVRKYADSGKIPVQRDTNGWRIFDERSIDVARGLAGVANNKGSKPER